MTALFADIKGSTELMRDLDPEEARAIVDPVLHLMMAAVHRYGGYVAQSTGYGIFALFGAPVAHEDHPQRAVCGTPDAGRREAPRPEAARRKRSQPANSDWREHGRSRCPIDRDGRCAYRVHTDWPFDQPRVAACRHWRTRGRFVISEAVRKLVEGYFALKPLGPARIKGVSVPVKVCEVTGLGPLRTRLQRSASHGLSEGQTGADTIKLSGLLLTSGLGHRTLLGKHHDFALRARPLGLHGTTALDHGAVVHDQDVRSQIAQHLGREPKLDALAGGDVAADLARHDDRRRLDWPVTTALSPIMMLFLA